MRTQTIAYIRPKLLEMVQFCNDASSESITASNPNEPSSNACDDTLNI
jgi:hypothetical protein